MAKKVLLIILLLSFILVTGCQTLQGIGGDLRWLGGARDEQSEDK